MRLFSQLRKHATAKQNIASLGGCVFWFDMSQASGTDNTAIADQINRSGRGKLLTSQNAAPLFQSAEMNGRHAASFNGTTQNFVIGDSSLNIFTEFGLSTDGTLYIVLKKTGGSGAVYTYAATGANRFGCYLNGSSGGSDTYIDWGNPGAGGRRNQGTTDDTSSYHLFSIRRTVNALSMRRDGSVWITVTDFTDTDGIGSGTGSFLIGSDDLAAGFSAMILCEFILFREAHSDPLRRRIERELGAKWGLVVDDGALP